VVGAWVRLIVNSAVVAAVAAAAQLGAGDALGVLGWNGPFDGRAWTTLLTWIAFSYAAAVLVGALVGRAAVRRRGGRDGLGARVLAALVAAGGAAAVIGFAWLPSQHLAPPANVNPGLVVSITAGAGVVVGFLVALLALAAPVIAAGAQATVAWLWLLAIGAAVAGLTSKQAYQPPRLGVPDAPSLFTESAWTGPRVMVYSAAALGLLVAGIGRARGARRAGVALAGLGGPVLVAAAYLIAGPGNGALRGSPNDPYINSLLAAAAGLIASALVALPGHRATRRASAPAKARAGAAAKPRANAAAKPRVGAAAKAARPAQPDVIETTRAPVPAPRPADTRPAWATGSGPYARAYTGTGHGGSSQPRTEPVTTPTRTTGWDADTLTGLTAVRPTGSADAGRPAESGGSGGLYRSSGSFEPAGLYELEPSPPQAGPRPETDSTPLPKRPTGNLTSSLIGQPPEEPHQSWFGDLGSAGRHAAAD
jgi:hypothetical protein